MIATSPHLWFYLASSAAVCWGIGYSLAEKVFKLGVNPYIFLSIAVATQVIAYPLFFYFTDGNFSRQIATFKNSNAAIFIALAVLSFVIGNACVFSSMQMKNASLSSMIEIAYPLLVVFFSWLFFREVHVNLYTMLGGLMIFSGVCLIFIKS